jgi:hypothetical protein
MVYFNDVLKFGKHGLQAVALGMRGEWDKVDDRMLDMLVDATSALLPYQEPLGTMYELATNRRLEGSLPETMLAGHRGGEGTLLSSATNLPGQIGDWMKKSGFPTLAPSPVLQAKRLIEGQGIRSASACGPDQADQSRRSYPTRCPHHRRREAEPLQRPPLGPRNDRNMSVENKRKEVEQMRKDWNSTLGPRLFEAVREWDEMLPRDRVLREFAGLGKYSVGVMLNEGRVPIFDEVFSESIPPEVRRR